MYKTIMLVVACVLLIIGGAKYLMSDVPSATFFVALACFNLIGSKSD